jgi:phosphogluconate dehydratase
VPAAIHVTPEAICGGPIARVRDGDIIRLDARAGTLEVQVTEAEFAARQPAAVPLSSEAGTGRELFATFRRFATDAESGALSCGT